MIKICFKTKNEKVCTRTQTSRFAKCCRSTSWTSLAHALRSQDDFVIYLILIFFRQPKVQIFENFLSKNEDKLLKKHVENLKKRIIVLKVSSQKFEECFWPHISCNETENATFNLFVLCGLTNE